MQSGAGIALRAAWLAPSSCWCLKPARAAPCVSLCPCASCRLESHLLLLNPQPCSSYIGWVQNAQPGQMVLIQYNRLAGPFKFEIPPEQKITLKIGECRGTSLPGWCQSYLTGTELGAGGIWHWPRAAPSPRCPASSRLGHRRFISIAPTPSPPCRPQRMEGAPGRQDAARCGQPGQRPHPRRCGQGRCGGRRGRACAGC